jgi:DNA polymerase I-like protein with 3'-5' exonuclease and polymerase domains
MSEPDPFLQRPGISQQFLVAAGVEYLETPEPQLRIPYHDVRGVLTGHWRSRLKQVRLTGQKYDQPAGSKSEVYCTHCPLVSGPYFHLTEGEFKCMALVEGGFQTIGLPGLHCYTRDTNDQPQLLPAIREAVQIVTPQELYFVGDSDTYSNLEYYRSAHMLATCFPSQRVKLLQLPLDGPKGVDDLKESLNGEFPTWMSQAYLHAVLMDPDGSFLGPALIQLELVADLIFKLPPLERERQIARVVQMTALARLAKEEPVSVIERFYEVGWKTTQLTKPAFERSVADEITRICAKTNFQTGTIDVDSEPAKFEETVKPAAVAVDGEALLDRLEKFVRRFTVLDSPDYYLISLAILETYLTDCFNCLAIIWVRSPEKRCGKSTLLDVLEGLVLKPLLCITASPASLYRLIERYHPSILIDEADQFGNENDDIRKIANGGFERGRKVPRVNRETGEIELFDTFGFKVLATIGTIHETVEDRSIPVHMNRKPRNLEVEDPSDVPAEEYRKFKEDCQRWADDHRVELKALRLARPKPLIDRNWRKWRSLLSIAWVTGENCFTKTLALGIHKAKGGDEELSIRLEILTRIRDLFRERKTDFLATTEILKYLNTDSEAPWADWVTGIKKGLTAHRLGKELRYFPVHSDQPKRAGFKVRGYWLKDFKRYFDAFLPPDDGSDPEAPPPKDEPPAGPSSSEEAFVSPESVEKGQVSEAAVVSPSESAPNRPHLGVSQSEAGLTCKTPKVRPVEPSKSTTYDDGLALKAEKPGKPENENLFIPDSTAKAPFRIPTNPERLLFLDLETFYPWPAEGSDFPQPKQSDPGELKRRRKRGAAHPWAKDPRRCVLRFLTVQLDDDLPITHDMMDGSIPETLRTLIATSTLVGHNLDFDITVLRRYGVIVSSSIRDTMLACRLLELGKEKWTAEDIMSCEVIDEGNDNTEVDERSFSNPADNRLKSVVARHVGIKIPKPMAKLGDSDWSVSPINDDQAEYIRWDVEVLPALWACLETELASAKLSACFAERMTFFAHLHTIKMTGVPVNVVLRDNDREETAGLKIAKREEVREMFKDYQAPVPKSRRKKVKAAKAKDGTPVISAPTVEYEEFNPNVPAQVIAALSLHGIEVENAQKETLQKIDSPEARLLLDYAAHKTRLSHIDGIARSTFHDCRVRAAGWNQLSARTGRITSTQPNLQNLPKAWRAAFEAPPPYYWLSIDLSQIEVYVIAMHTGCERMIEILRAGKDIYVETIAPIIGVSPVRGNAPDQVSDVYREVGKKLVLGTDYGLTVYGFIRQIKNATGLEFTLDEAHEFFNAFFRMYPEIKAYHDKAEKEAFDAISVRTISGQRRFLPPLKGELNPETGYWPSYEFRKRVLLNTPIQGSAADLLIYAVNWFFPQLLDGVELLNLVHDEVNALATKDLLLPTYQIIAKGFDTIFRQFYGDRLPVKVSGYAGRSWADKNKLHEFVQTL